MTYYKDTQGKKRKLWYDERAGKGCEVMRGSGDGNGKEEGRMKDAHAPAAAADTILHTPSLAVA